MGSRYRSEWGRNLLQEWCRRRLDQWPVPHHRREIETSLGRTHLVMGGSDGPTVLYLPGTNFNAATSLALATELAARARIVLADLPGQPGLSTGERPTSPAAAYGAWAGEVLDWLRPSVAEGPVVLAGHSLGAAAALAAPTSGVAALVLISPAGLVRLTVTPMVLRHTLPWLTRPSDERSRALLQHMTAPARTPDLALVSWMTLVARHTKPSGAPGPLPEATLLRWSDTPRAVLSGEHDCFLPLARLSPVVASRLATDLTVLTGLGHLCVQDDPAGVATAIVSVDGGPGEPSPERD